jgi:hypothetical protein
MAIVTLPIISALLAPAVLPAIGVTLGVLTVTTMITTGVVLSQMGKESGVGGEHTTWEARVERETWTIFRCTC